MFGVQLYPDGADPLSVEIPWAFPEGSLEKLKTRLGELAEQAAEKEKDGFRDWLYRTGEQWVSSRSKYISFVDDIVTLEKEDGSEMTIEFSHFNDLDKNYIRRRLEIEKMTPEEQEYFKQLRQELIKGTGMFAPRAELRIWRSPLGEHEMRATFVSGTDNANVIHLKREDGVVIEAYMDLLSPVDQEYVKQRLNAEKEEKP